MPIYEAGFSRLRIDNPLDKVSKMVADLDKMSALGWEFKAFYDSINEMVMLYQRVQETPVTPSEPTPPVTTAPTAEPVIKVPVKTTDAKRKTIQKK